MSLLLSHLYACMRIIYMYDPPPNFDTNPRSKNKHKTLENTGQPHQTRVHRGGYHIYIYIYILFRFSRSSKGLKKMEENRGPLPRFFPSCQRLAGSIGPELGDAGWGKLSEGSGGVPGLGIPGRLVSVALMRLTDTMVSSYLLATLFEHPGI